MAEELGRSVHTIRVHKNSAMKKLGEKTNTGLVRAAVEKGLIKS